VALPPADGRICGTCDAVHNPDRCQGHSRNQAGSQCKAYKVTGLSVCRRHGGATGASQAKSQMIKAEAYAAREAQSATTRRVRMVLGQFPAAAVEDPLRELQLLAGEMKQWKQAMAERVAELLEQEKLRYGTDGGEAIRGEIQLYERSMDRLATTLAMIAKLNIDERLVKIAEGQKEMILAAIEAGLAKVNVTGPMAVEARIEAGRYLRTVSQMPAQITAA